MRNIITISKKLIQKDDLVIIPRREYEGLLMLRKKKELVLTLEQKKRLIKAENNLKFKKSLSYNEVARKLGFKN